jgi:hypothetical protein
MRFYGSAMPFPHIQGAFRERLVALASQYHKVADGVPIGEAALAEPFAVTLHAVARAGSLLGKRVLVSGCGAIRRSRDHRRARPRRPRDRRYRRRRRRTRLRRPGRRRPHDQRRDRPRGARRLRRPQPLDEGPDRVLVCLRRS